MSKTKISLEEMKQIEVDILISIDSFCKKNNLSYALGYGTLIGAVRHHGFIPWDDDIDIFMPRPDYDRFIELYQDAAYKLLCMEHGNYYRTYAKVYDSRTIIENTNNQDMGVFVDVIPIDGLPANKKDAQRYLSKMVKMRRWMYKMIDTCIYGKTKSPVRSLFFHLFGFFYPVSRLISLYNKRSKKYLFYDSEYVAGFAVGADNWLFKREYVEGRTELPFEGHLFQAPLNYDKFLRAVYGDYMQLPPEEERVPKHSYLAFWK